jgi:hypothetical protein
MRPGDGRLGETIAIDTSPLVGQDPFGADSHCETIPVGIMT